MVTDPIAFVNTFVGTKDEGNTFPGAALPSGMAQSSPIGSHYAGWRYDDERIRGFGHFFLSGAGCYEQGGLVSILPVTGDLPRRFDHREYASPFTHEGEIGRPGYFRVRLTGHGGIDAECTATTRTGVERFTFPAGSRPVVLVNVGQANDREPVFASDVRLVDDRTVTGSVVSQGFCGGRPYPTHFVTRFDRPCTDSGTWSDGPLRGAWLRFDGADRVTSVTALSHVDVEGALRNLEAEVYDGDSLLGFDELRVKAEYEWRAELSCVDIETADDTDRTVFYTALYHVLLQPLVGSDVDGRYLGFDDQVHTADGWTYYEYFSLWDTYRAHNQLMALLRPDRCRDIGRSVVTIAHQGGWLPRWAYGNVETNCMTGDPVTPFLVDLWRFGLLGGIEEAAFEALWRNATSVPPPSSRFSGRAGNHSYLDRGFVQYDKRFPKKGQDVDPHHGASATFEYALADSALAVMAEALGHPDGAEVLRQRALNYRVLWDPSVRDRGFTGFPRPKVDDGDWLEPYGPQGPDGFHEGTAWQYQWLAQHDAAGLVDLMGGQQAALSRLDDFFAMPELLTDHATAVREHWVVGAYDYYDQFRYNPNNEPDLHAPWMYTLFGDAWRTSAVVRAAQTLFVDGPGGVTGNDDLGTMSAWYVFSALGFYPVIPGTGRFVLHAPRFERVVLHLDGGDLVIEAPGADPARLQYISDIHLDGESWSDVYVSFERLRCSGLLTYSLTLDSAQAGWGRFSP